MAKKKAKNFIAKMHMKPAALHEQMGVPADMTIPRPKLAKAALAGGLLGKRARLAQTLEAMHH